MSTPRHPNKHINEAVQHALSLGWRLEMSNGHAWGFLYCPLGARGGCCPAVWSTPKSPENFAKKLRREIDACSHRPPEDPQ
jgi:hypothetical protein